MGGIHTNTFDLRALPTFKRQVRYESELERSDDATVSLRDNQELVIVSIYGTEGTGVGLRDIGATLRDDLARSTKLVVGQKAHQVRQVVAPSPSESGGSFSHGSCSP